jgi:hypothetical protein
MFCQDAQQKQKCFNSFAVSIPHPTAKAVYAIWIILYFYAFFQ